jgi:hypothetical protein
VGPHFSSAGAEVYWLVDRADAGAPTLTELLGSPSGTRVETTWRGSAEDLARRLQWAGEHGTLAVPELPRGDAKNLYH